MFLVSSIIQYMSICMSVRIESCFDMWYRNYSLTRKLSNCIFRAIALTLPWAISVGVVYLGWSKAGDSWLITKWFYFEINTFASEFWSQRLFDLNLAFECLTSFRNVRFVESNNGTFSWTEISYWYMLKDYLQGFPSKELHAFSEWKLFSFFSIGKTV